MAFKMTVNRMSYIRRVSCVLLHDMMPCVIFNVTFAACIET